MPDGLQLAHVLAALVEGFVVGGQAVQLGQAEITLRTASAARTSSASAGGGYAAHPVHEVAGLLALEHRVFVGQVNRGHAPALQRTAHGSGFCRCAPAQQCRVGAGAGTARAVAGWSAAAISSVFGSVRVGSGKHKPGLRSLSQVTMRWAQRSAKRRMWVCTLTMSRSCSRVSAGTGPLAVWVARPGPGPGRRQTQGLPLAVLNRESGLGLAVLGLPKQWLTACTSAWVER